MLHVKIKKYFFVFFTMAVIGLNVSVVLAAKVNLNLVYDGVKHKYSAEEIKINVNGNPITGLSMPPVSINGRTLVPARAVFEAMNSEVTWNESTKEVYIMKGKDVAVIKINSNTGILNGTPFALEVAPKIINDTTMIPVRQVAEALGATVLWEEQSRTVQVNEVPDELPPVVDEPVEVPTPTPPVVTPPAVTPPTVAPPVVDVPVTNPGEITVESVMLPTGTSGDFVINATGTIGKYQTLDVSDNRLVIDIYNANMGITNTNIAVSGNAYVSSIRSAQNQVTPEKITRIVFDLKDSGKYQITQSNDKKSLILSFSENEVTGLNVEGRGSADFVMIDGKTAPGVQISALENPKRIVLDMQNTKSTLNASYAAIGCNFITDIQTIQFGDNTSRIILTIKENEELEYTVAKQGTSTVVTLRKSTLQNISYNPSTRTLSLKGLDGLSASQIVHNDDYLNLKYTLTLPGDFSAQLGDGNIQINDEYLNSISISNNASNQTQLIFHETQILAYTAMESDGIAIKVQKPKDKYNAVILLDAGHGKADPGTNGNGYIEKDINLSILLKVQSRFQNDQDIKIYVTRMTDGYPTNPERAAMANQISDLFVSIHQNSASPNPVPSGTEILYTPHSNETAGKLTSKQAADIMLEHVRGAIDSKNRGVKNDPAIIVLNQTKVPAILIECGFLSNPEEAAKLGSQQYQEKIADAIALGIREIVAKRTLR